MPVGVYVRLTGAGIASSPQSRFCTAAAATIVRGQRLFDATPGLAHLLGMRSTHKVNPNLAIM